MKKTLLGLFLIISSISFAQSSYGIKAGLNYNGNGDVKDSAGDVLENPDHNVGFHVGVFGKIGSSLFLGQSLCIRIRKVPITEAGILKCKNSIYRCLLGHVL